MEAREPKALYHSVAAFCIIASGSEAILSWDSTPLLFGLRNAGGLAGLWELPGGKSESGEDLRQTLVREFQEEFNAVPQVFGSLGQSTFAHGSKNFVLTGVLCSLAEIPSLHPEHSKLTLMTAHQALETRLVDSDRTLLAGLVTSPARILQKLS